MKLLLARSSSSSNRWFLPVPRRTGSSFLHWEASFFFLHEASASERGQPFLFSLASYDAFFIEKWLFSLFARTAPLFRGGNPFPPTEGASFFWKGGSPLRKEAFPFREELFPFFFFPGTESCPFWRNCWRAFFFILLLLLILSDY